MQLFIICLSTKGNIFLTTRAGPLCRFYTIKIGHKNLDLVLRRICNDIKKDNSFLIAF